MFLINIGFETKKDDGYGPGVRFRALRVLQSVTDEATLQDVTKRDPELIRYFIFKKISKDSMIFYYFYFQGIYENSLLSERTGASRPGLQCQ